MESDAKKLGRFQRKRFSDNDNFVLGRDMQSVDLNGFGANSEILEDVSRQNRYRSSFLPRSSNHASPVSEGVDSHLKRISVSGFVDV